MRLKNPQTQIPNGYSYYEPATKWRTRPFMSLDAITSNLLDHRRSRPDLVKQHGWSLDPKVVRAEVEAFNVQICLNNGWHDYLIEGESPVPPPPFVRPRSPQSSSPLQKLRNVVGTGAETIVEWITDGSQAVAPELSEHRASVCIKCPQNKEGGWETFFTVPASRAIHKEIERKNGMNLKTSHDDKLKVCGACTCPLPLMVHVPLYIKLKHMPQASRDLLDPNCWILSEEKGK